MNNNENIKQVELANIIKSKLIINSVAKDNNITVSEQKLTIHSLENYHGSYFLNSVNCCKIRCFDNEPKLVSIICEYTLETKVEDVDEVEIHLRKSLIDIGFTMIRI